MRIRPSIGVLWLTALIILVAGGCGKKKTADTVAPEAPAQQAVTVPTPAQTDSATPAQPAAPAQSSGMEPPNSAAAGASGAGEVAKSPTSLPPSSPVPPAPAEPEAKPSALAATSPKPSPAMASKKPAPAPTKQPPAPAKARPAASTGGATAQPKAAAASPAASQPKPRGTVVIGTIQVVSNVPDPSTVPYDTCVTFIKYRVTKVLNGSYDGDELLAVFWGMKAGKLQPAARFTTGQTHRLTIEPFDNQKDLARVMQADDTNEYSLTPYWVISHSDE